MSEIERIYKGGSGKMMSAFDDLIREGKDTDALRLMARKQYDNGRIGHTRMLLMIRVADELDDAKRELSFSRGARQKQSIREFLADIADNEIIPGKPYSHRVELNDGGSNSYIALNVYVDDWKYKPRKVIQEVTIFRHTNSADKLENEWHFSLGNVCHLYADEPNIPLEFKSYGKSPDEAETEAAGFFDELKRLVRKQTSVYKAQAAQSAQEEREQLLARLSELEAQP